MDLHSVSKVSTAFPTWLGVPRSVSSNQRHGEKPAKEIATVLNLNTEHKAGPRKACRLIDLPTNSVAREWSENVIVTAIAPDDETIAVGDLHTIRLYDTRTGELKRDLSKNLGLEN